MTGSVVVGVCPSLPIPVVTFILGKYLAGGDVWEKTVADCPVLLKKQAREVSLVAAKQMTLPSLHRYNREGGGAQKLLCVSCAPNLGYLVNSVYI